MSLKNETIAAQRRKQSILSKGLWVLVTLIFVVGPALRVWAVEDEAITEAVEHELICDEAIPFDLIDVSTIDGIVTLTGRVGNLLAKERAAKIAGVVKGVTAVVNQIEVVPSFARTDRQIEQDIEGAILFNPATEIYEVTVKVDAFEATLSGTVDSRIEKMLVGNLAKSIRGVSAVSNQIRVREAQDRSDPAIMADVEQALKWDVLIDDALIDVRVKNRKVILTGVVGSVAEKNHAIYVSGVAGVQDVDASGLAVKRWARDDDLRGDKYFNKSDVDIRKAVERALMHDPRVSSAEISVDVTTGMVSLRGNVDSVFARRAAVQDAENTVGVLSVRNRLKVKPGTEVSEVSSRDIADKIRGALARDAWLGAFEIDVTVNDDIVYLDGKVNNYFEKARADDLAASVKGVRMVINDLNVYKSNSNGLFDPYVDEWDVRNYDWYHYQPGFLSKRDLEIKAGIKYEFVWSPFVDADDITVTVERGTATLTGTVGSKSEKSMAEANAYEGGAIQVINKLEVRSN